MGQLQMGLRLSSRLWFSVFQQKDKLTSGGLVTVGVQCWEGGRLLLEDRQPQPGTLHYWP